MGVVLAVRALGIVLTVAVLLLAALGAVVVVEVVAVPLVVPPMADLALSVAEGEVRTKVPVSLRCTAFRLASAAVFGDTPTASGVDVIVGVWAHAPPTAKARTAARGISFE